MTLSKKYLSMAALALLCAAVFPSCKGDGKKDQPTPPPAEEKSLISSVTVKGRSEYRYSTEEFSCTYQYSYDEAGRVSLVAVRGDVNRDYSFTYGDGMMSIAVNSERIEFLTDANGYIVRNKTGDFYFSASHDTEGHLLQLLWEDYNSYTLKWEGDLLTEALCSSDYYGSTTTTLVYSKTMNPAGLGGIGIIYGNLGGELSDGKTFPVRMWLGKEPAYLPSKVITHNAKDGKQYSEEITTFDATPDAKGRPVKILVTETYYEYDQYKGKNPLPYRKDVFTIEITYK